MAFAFFLLLKCMIPFAYGESGDEILMKVHDREITRDEFLFHFRQTGEEYNRQNIMEYLDLFIDFQLKLAQAREEQVNKNVNFINELAEYRMVLAAPYLIDKEKAAELAGVSLERLNYEVNATHILVKLENGSGPEDTLKAYDTAISLRNLIMAGESLEEVAKSCADDTMTLGNPRNTGFFTAFQTEYPFEEAVYSMKPGEISLPVRSSYGYHIIRLDEKRERTGETRTEQEIIDLIIKAKDARAQMIEDSFVEKLKKYWNFKENPGALDTIYRLADERVYRGNWVAPADHSFNEPLFSLDSISVYQNELIDFMGSFSTEERDLPIKEYIFSLYQKFVSARLIQYENYKLEEKYPEFRFQFQEYRDAMMLLEITGKKLWSNEGSDSVEMKNWIEDLRVRYSVTIYEEVLSSII